MAIAAILGGCDVCVVSPGMAVAFDSVQSVPAYIRS